MIQRIQSLYWLVAAICLSFVNFGMNIFSFKIKDTVYEFDFYSLTEFVNGKIVKSQAKFHTILSITIFVLIVVAIFSYKNLKRQLKLSQTISFLTLMLFIEITLSAYGGLLINNAESIVPNFGYYLLPITLILNFLAQKGVKKDKKLLDSVDRIR